MQLPIALIVATRAVQQQFESARPNAPALAEVPVQRLLRTRKALSAALYATARLVAPREVRPARSVTGTV
jgi:hypothetical protein